MITGLPLDITDEEFTDMMSKYGIIMQDPDTSKFLSPYFLWTVFYSEITFRR